MSSDHALISFSYWCLRKILGPIIRLIWIKKVVGLEKIPKNTSAVLAFNHQSFLDFLCFAAVSPRNVHFLSAEKFFAHPVWGILMILTGQIKVERNSNDKSLVHKFVGRHVKKKMLIGIFPEGTRSPFEFEMLKAYTGIAKYALRHNIPIVPVGIRGTYSAMAKHDKWPKFRKTVEIHIDDSIDCSEHNGKHEDNWVCTIVTENVIEKIERLSGKKYPHYESRK